MIRNITTQIAMFIALSLSASAAQSAIFTNSASVTIVDEAPASSFPAIINVNGMNGGITSLTVTLNNVTHSNYNDVSIVLLGPNGQSIMLQNGISSGSSTISNITYTFADGSPNLPAINALTNGTYKPTNYLASEQFDAPAPPPPAPAAPGTYFLPGPTAGGTATFVSVFGGSVANGQWKLFIQDFAGGDDGVMSGGWALNVTTSGSSLPIQLNSFVSTVTDCRVDLYWSTVYERNVRNYEVQKSLTSSDFVTVASIEASNTTNSKYEYADYNVIDKSYQYRLKMNDVDGKSTFSDVATASVACHDNTIKVYPNPSFANATLEFYANATQNLTVTIRDQLGRNISSEVILVHEGLSKNELNTKVLSVGMYLISIYSEDINKTFQFRKGN